MVAPLTDAHQHAASDALDEHGRAPALGGGRGGSGREWMRESGMREGRWEMGDGREKGRRMRAP